MAEEQIEEHNEDQKEEFQIRSTGVVRGVPGESVGSVGVLDLRGMTADELQKLKRVDSVGVILIDSGQRAALAHVEMSSVGSVTELAPNERLMMQPFTEFTRQSVEAMAAGQRFTQMGVLAFAADVSAELVQEKFDAIRLMGVLIAPQAVVGALFGKLDHTGMTITLLENEGPFIRNMGHNTLSTGYLRHLADGSTYLNMGKTDVEPDVPEELLAAKIARYHNLGATEGPKPLIELLKARTATDAGAFIFG
ncbi:MAG: hypothetical protein OHK0029_43310 [Armatimonadaceae bacterium]